MNFLMSGSDYLLEAARKDFRLVGRTADLERLTSILLRNKSSSVILVGPGGVGCTALCMGLQASKKDPDAAFDVVNKRIFWLDTDGLFSSGSADQITSNFDKIIEQLNRTPDSILIVDDARDFIDAARANGLGNFINSLNNAVKKGKTQVILETRDDDLDVVLKAHSDMRERYTLIDLAEPSNGALREIVMACLPSLVEHHGVKVSEDSVDAAIELTTKYRTRDLGLSRAQPERTMTLLDRSLAYYRLNAHKQPAGMPALLAQLGDKAYAPEGQAQIADMNAAYVQDQAKIKELYKNQRDGENMILEYESQIDALKTEAKDRLAPTDTDPQHRLNRELISMGQNGGLESKAVEELRGKIKRVQDLVNANAAEFKALTAKINEKLEVTRDIVVKQFSLISGIDVSRLTQDERKKLRNLEAGMLTRIYGQNNAVHRLANAIKVAKAGKRTAGKPVASFLFMGPSGVGKTELAKVLTQLLLDDEAALTRFDMSEYMEKHAVAKLIGAPPGYEGFEVGGILTNAMRKNPVRVLLFDEIEKAHPDVFNLFLQILSDSRLSDNVGRVVSFDDAVIIMTTNIGQPAFLNEKLTDQEAERDAMVELDATYRPELLNRFAGRENIVCFRRLDLDSVGKIVRRELTAVGDKYVDNGIRLAVSDDTIAAFCHDRYEPKVGARGLPGFIASHLEPVLANLSLDNPDFQGTLEVSYNTTDRRFETHMIETDTVEECSHERQRSAA